MTARTCNLLGVATVLALALALMYIPPAPAQDGPCAHLNNIETRWHQMGSNLLFVNNDLQNPVGVAFNDAHFVIRDDGSLGTRATAGDEWHAVSWGATNYRTETGEPPGSVEECLHIDKQTDPEDDGTLGNCTMYAGEFTVAPNCKITGYIVEDGSGRELDARVWGRVTPDGMTATVRFIAGPGLVVAQAVWTRHPEPENQCAPEYLYAYPIIGSLYQSQWDDRRCSEKGAVRYSLWDSFGDAVATVTRAQASCNGVHCIIDLAEPVAKVCALDGENRRMGCVSR